MLDWHPEAEVAGTTSREIDRQLSAEQKASVRSELSRVLASDSFASSRRCSAFVTHTVECALSGDYDSLTERFLGVKLFGRPVDYETATDSIVRVRANDVRRRLLQHYSVANAGSNVRIEMIAGNYVPEFRWIDNGPPDSPSLGHMPATGPVLPADEDAFSKPVAVRPERRWWRSRAFWGTAAGASVLIPAVLFFILRAARPSDFDSFWAPVLTEPGQPVLSLPTTDTVQLTLDAHRTLCPLGKLQPGQSFTLGYSDFVGFHDWHVSLPVLQATLSVAMTLDRKGKPPLVRLGTDLRRDELRGHPIIAIGSFSNPWAEAAVSGLRFTFDRGASDREVPRIRDAQNASRTWTLPVTYPAPQHKDYAIITRTFDPVTHEPFISLAGLHSFGNQIAGEFVAQDSAWKEVAQRAPVGWKTMNLQIVLEADVVGTTPASPRIIDVYFWR